VGRKGGAGQRFEANTGSFELTGVSVNVDQIRWNFPKGATTKVKVAGKKWSITIFPLKKGVNIVQVSGWNTAGNLGSKPTNVVIIRN
jgi:hypothetical protein